jgi:hypothetical protein
MKVLFTLELSADEIVETRTSAPKFQFRRPDEAAVAEALGNQFDLHQFGERLSKPVGHYLITESTPLANPYWQYSRDKIACEERPDEGLSRRGFSDHDCAPFADLRRYADCAGGE